MSVVKDAVWSFILTALLVAAFYLAVTNAGALERKWTPAVDAQAEQIVQERCPSCDVSEIRIQIAVIQQGNGLYSDPDILARRVLAKLHKAKEWPSLK